MSTHLSRPPRPILLLGLAFLALLVVGSGLAWLLARQGIRSPLRVLLITPPTGADSGLDFAQHRAIGALIQDHLEQSGGFAVTAVTEVPAELEPFRRQPRTLLILSEPRRRGDDLELSYRFAWGGQLVRGTPPRWNLHKADALPPFEAFRSFLGTFPHQGKGSVEGLMVRSPGLFWELVQAGAWRLQNQHLEEAMALAEEATRREPACASTWILLGNLRYRELLNSQSAFRQQQVDAEGFLQKGLSLAPGHPRATLLLSLLKSDNGNQREALDLLLRARRKQPNNPLLLTGVAYAARGAGLLALSRRAIDLRDDLALQPQAVDITCLYTGEIQRFEAGLKEQPGHLRSTSGVVPFYRGYLALVRGDRILAQQEFRAAAELANGYPNIKRLSEIFGLILQGRKDEAWKKLHEYDQARTGMREPDGEFTIRLAEAYALLGDRASAMEMANRAFARGFGCTAWYERSPMLASLRGLPKWNALLQHLRERQALMEERFPVGLLEDN